MKRTLPIYTIEGTDFEVDVANLQLREKANPDNKISLFEMRDVGDGYVFDYSPVAKNLPDLFSEDTDIKQVKIPELVQLDATGMAAKYGLSVDAVEGKKDFDIMVDQQAYRERLGGKLVTVGITGHTFYVDIRMDMLRPKDDFLSKGIVFSQIDHYYSDDQDRYIIPYDPKTHEFREPDYDTITKIPQDLIIVSFPHESRMDPIGFNRKIGLDEADNLKETNVQSHFEAKIVNWKDTQIEQIIQKNLQRQQQQQKQNRQKQKNNKRQHRGRKM